MEWVWDGRGRPNSYSFLALSCIFNELKCIFHWSNNAGFMFMKKLKSLDIQVTVIPKSKSKLWEVKHSTAPHVQFSAFPFLSESSQKKLSMLPRVMDSTLLIQWTLQKA